ncbi:MAG TPA: AAA family ATPase, partial [Fimbriimonas sp.]|nr:AAA family ATPase [Fimbriimonas sp.]
MKLLRLRATNFRQHAQTDITFHRGMTAIVGANGVGKSTILEMIGFALFGEQRQQKSTILFQWADSKKFGVVLTFECDGVTLEVSRFNDTASLKEIGDTTEKVLATALSDVTAAVEKKLGLTYEQFVNSFCAEQKGLAFLNFKSNTARQEEVGKMLGIDRLRAAEESARKLANDRKTTAAAIESALGDPEEIRLEREGADSEIKQVDLELAENAKTLHELEENRSAIATRAAEARNYNDLTTEIAAHGSRAEALKNAVSTAGDALDEASAEVTRRTAIEAEALRFQEVKASFDELKRAETADLSRQRVAADLTTAEQTALRLETEFQAIPECDLSRAEQKVLEGNQRVTTARSAYDAARDAWLQTKNDAAVAVAGAETNHRHATMALERARVQVAAGKCPECGQPFGEDFTTALEKLSATANATAATLESARAAAGRSEPAELEAARTELADAEREHAELADALKSTRSVNEKRSQLQTSLAGARQRVGDLEKQLASMPAAFDASALRTVTAEHDRLFPLHQEYQRLSGAPERLERATAQKIQADADLQLAKDEFNKLKAQRTELGFATREAVDVAITTLAQFEGHILRLTEAATSLEHRKATAQSNLRQAIARGQRLAENEQALKTAKAERALYETIATEMKALRVNLNASIGPELAARASENLSLLTNGRYPLLQLDANFTPSLV